MLPREGGDSREANVLVSGNSDQNNGLDQFQSEHRDNFGNDEPAVEQDQGSFS